MKKNNKKIYKKIFKYFLKYKKELIILIITGILSTIIGTIEPFITAKEYTSIINIDVNNIIKYAIIVFLIRIISNIIFSITSLVSEKYTQKIELDLQKT